MYAITVADWETRVAFLGSLGDRIGVGKRHESTEVRGEGNRAYGVLRDRVHALGYDYFQTTTSPAAIPGRDADFDFSIVDLPADCEALNGVDARTTGDSSDYWYELDPVPWSERYRYSSQHTGGTGTDGPLLYAVEHTTSLSGGTATALTAGRVALCPSGSGLYVLRYTPRWTDVSADDELFLYQNASWYDWHVAETVLRISGLRDAGAQERISAAQQLKATAEQSMPAIVRKTRKQSPIATRHRNFRSTDVGNRRTWRNDF